MPTLNGLLVVDKPAGRTSRDVVNEIQRRLPRGTRIGHTGTLDPLATGVLVLCLGPATRLAEFVQDMPKTYCAGLLLGTTSDTDDADGMVTPVADALLPNEVQVRAALQGFVGEIDQVPPAFSAARVTGQRAYDLARRGQAVQLAPRRVFVHGIDVERYVFPRLDLVVRCGKGTYIRSLARDLGERLGCGALVEALRRTQVGPFMANEGLSLETPPAELHRHLLAPDAAFAGMPSLQLRPGVGRRLAHGQAVPLGEAASAGDLRRGKLVALDEAKRAIAVVACDSARGLLVPVKVLPPDASPAD
jgi:tRNA pseudouridine55 synthase